MNKLSDFFSNVSRRFDSVLSESRGTMPEPSSTLYLSLCLAAFACLAIASLGYFTSGYHWGFTPINTMSRHISPIFLHNLTTFGDGIFIVSLVLFVANRNVPLLYSALIAAIVGGLVSQSLKRYFNADRPPAVLELEAFNLVGKAYYSRSFPSGHTLTAFLVATVFICFSKKMSTKIALITLAFGVGLSRVWLGVHWLIDILVGAGLGIFCALVSVFIARRTVQKLAKPVLIFIIILFSITAVSALLEPNDYRFAQPLISLIAVLALWKTYKAYLGSVLFERHGTATGRIVPTFLVTLIIITAYRIFVLFQPHMSLFYDEAYYYHWSLTPDWGYYSKPPFVAWCISLGTLIAGHTVVGVKLAAPLLYSASSFILYLIGKKVASVKAGVMSALIFLSAPVIGFNSEFVTTDAPLIFFWSSSIYLFICCLHSDKLIYWIALGCSVGFGLLSKYTMILLPASLFFFLLVNKQHRSTLLSYKPWLSALLAGSLFALNLWWNSQHEWISFAHTSEISKQDSGTLNILGLLEFLAGQIFVLGPIWFWLACTLIAKRAKLVNECKADFGYAPKIFIYSALGILLAISIQAITSRAFVNWAAPWIVGCSLALGMYLSAYSVSKYLRVGLISHLLLLSAFYHWPQLLNQLQIEPSRKNNPYQRLAGWDEVALKLQPILRQYPEAKLASDSRDLLAYLGFHAKPKSLELARWNPDEANVRDHYDLKFNLRNYVDSETSFIFVSKKPLSPLKLARFDKAYSLGKIQQQVFKDKAHEVYIYRLVGFNGYE